MATASAPASSSSTTRKRLSPNSPLVREYTISSVQKIKTQPDVVVCKYLTMQKQGETWVDVVRSEWVYNPEDYDLVGRAIRITTEIV